jgi:hypothetical protein
VKPLNSPHAAFTVPVRNAARERREVALRVDSYTLPTLPECGELPVTDNPRLSRDEILSRLRAIAEVTKPTNFPMPQGWTVTVTPAEFVLAGGEERDVVVDITAPDGFAGEKTFNVNGFAVATPLGGVTLTVRG